MKFIEKLKTWQIALGLFLIWRFLLFLIAYIATNVLPVSRSLFPYKDTLLESTKLPSWIWGFGSFDGVHYLRIALMGYKESQFSQAFFPLYPAFIKLLSSQFTIFWSGIVVSNLLFLLCIFFIYKLFLIEYDKKTSLLSVLFLLVFPTSFYFGSIYSESLFILMVTLSIYFLKKKNYPVAGLFALIASATRLVGVFLFFAFLYELALYIKDKGFSNKEEWIKRGLGLVLSPLGLVFYMLYLRINFNDPLLFLTSPGFFNTGRTGFFILLPQVLFRYLKIFISIHLFTFSFFNAFLEFFFTLFALYLLIFSFKKTNKGVWIFLVFLVMTPTLTGTLTSMPRYILPVFLVFPLLIKRLGNRINAFLLLSFLFECILVALFTRGYWIA